MEAVVDGTAAADAAAGARLAAVPVSELHQTSALVALARDLPVLGALARVTRRAIRRTGGSTLPDAQVEVLRVVEANPGIGTGGVAEHLQLVPNTVSTLVGELVTAGLLHRARDANDRRAARLRLTPEAVAALVRWGAVRDDVVSSALARLDPADRAALATAIPAARRLVAVLDSVESSSSDGNRHLAGQPSRPG